MKKVLTVGKFRKVEEFVGKALAILLQVLGGVYPTHSNTEQEKKYH